MIKLNKPGTEEIVEVILSETKYPVAFANKLAELMEQGAFNTEAEARQWLATNPICLELYYEKHHGLFAVESESLDGSPEAICSPYSKEPFFDLDVKWVDLGLPSGRLWAAENEPGYHQFDEAVKTFGEMLPSEEAWKELFDRCDRKWDKDRKGYVLTGPNGKTLFLPAKGWQHYNKETKELNGGGVYYVGGGGFYWSSSPYGVDYARNVYFNGGDVNPQNYDYRLRGFSVRLCQEP